MFVEYFQNKIERL